MENDFRKTFSILYIFPLVLSSICQSCVILLKNRGLVDRYEYGICYTDFAEEANRDYLRAPQQTDRAVYHDLRRAAQP